MSTAFQSPKLDTYLDRQKQLDRRVLSRYRLDDPFQAASGEDWYGFPSYGVWYCSPLRAVASRIRPDRLNLGAIAKPPLKNIGSVARFGQMMGDGAGFTFFVRKDMKEAYSRLGALSQVEGNNAAAAFYAALADQVAKTAETSSGRHFRARFQGSDVSHWNAFLVRLSGLLMLFCAAPLTSLRTRCSGTEPLAQVKLATPEPTHACPWFRRSHRIAALERRPFCELQTLFRTPAAFPEQG